MDLMDMLTEYVGNKRSIPDGGEVTYEMIIEELIEEAPSIALLIAQENFIRGYAQAMCDVGEVTEDTTPEIV
jgi:hypothetical protein